MKITKGKILLASPFLEGKYFRRSVILIVDDGVDGFLGLRLNKPLTITVNQVIKPNDNIQSPIYLGGPVDNQLLFFIHTRPDIIPLSVKLTDTLYWSGDFNYVLSLMSKGVLKENEIKFFSGYSGWKVDMLHDEIKEKSWFVCEFGDKYIMSSQVNNMWEIGMSKLDANINLLNKYPRGFNLN